MALDLSSLKYLSPVALAGEQINKSPTAKNFLFGQPARTELMSRYTPEIQQSLNQNILQYLQGQGTSPMQQQATRQFQSDIIPAIAERFAGRGASGALQGKLGAAGAGLAENLQARRFQELMSLLQAGGQETNYFPAQPGLAQFLPQAAIELGKAYLTGGASLPATGLSALQGLFGGQSGQPTEGPRPLTSAPSFAGTETQASTFTPRDTALQNLIDSILGRQIPGLQKQGEMIPSPETQPGSYRLGGNALTQQLQNPVLQQVLGQLKQKYPSQFGSAGV